MSFSASLRRSPYQGLIPYGEDDAPYFFGREKEARLIVANLFASPLTLLYGASGVGKSSVLRAGVVHQLRGRDDLLVVVFNTWQGNPVIDLMQAVAAEAEVANNGAGAMAIRNLAQDRPASLVEFLAVCAEKLDRRLMIILDQFEEYFLYHSQDEEFATEFPKAARQSDAPVSFLISIREDFYAKLDRFEGRVPALYDNYLRLEHLNRQAARVAIEKPLEEYNRLYAKEGRRFSIEPELVEAVLRQVEKGQVILGEGRGVVEATKSREDADAQIETPYLQLVMTRLWEEEVRERSYKLRLGTLSNLGGAENIVRKHLDEVMSALLPREQEIAASIFHYLVTPSGTKIAYTAADLAGSAELNQPEVVSVLEKLAHGDIRILRPVDAPLDQPTALRYEIFHDVLAPAILAWRAVYVQTQERAEAQRSAEEQQRRAEEQARLEEQGKVAGRLRRLSVALAVVTLLALGFAAYAMSLRGKAVASERVAVEEAGKARFEKAEAEKQAGYARANEDEAKKQAALAKVNEDEAKKQAALAKTNEDEAKKQTALAKTNEDEANRQRKLAGDEARIAREKRTEAEKARADADAQRVIAEQQRSIAASRELAAAASDNLDSDPELSVLLGVEALSKLSLSRLSGHTVTETDEKEAKSALHEAIQASRVELTLPPFSLSKDPPSADPTDPTDPTDLHFSSDKKPVVIVGRNGIATVWDGVTGTKSRVLSGPVERVERAALSPDGSWFATAGPGPRTNVLLWNTATGEQVNVKYDEARLGALWHLAFINAGKTLVLGGYVLHPDKQTHSVTLQLWDVASSHPGEFYDLSNGLATSAPTYVAFSSDAKRILTCGETLQATVWEAETPSGRVLSTIETEDPALSPDGKLVAGVVRTDRSSELKLWDADSGKEVRSFCSPGCGGCPGLFEKPVFSPDGKNLAASDMESGIIRVWERASGRTLITTSGYSKNEVALATTTVSLKKRRELVKPPFSFSADGRLFAAYCGRGTIKVWSASTGNEFFTIAGHKGFVTSMAFNSNGQHLITGADDGTARVWDVSRSHEVFTTARLGESRLVEVGNVTYSPDGTRLAGSLREGGLGVWDTKTWKEAYTAPFTPFSKSDWGRSVTYSPDGRCLAVADERGKVTLVDADSGKIIGSPFKVSNRTIYDLAFSNDGKKLAAASVEGLYVLDTQDPSRITKSPSIAEGVISVAFSSDGKYLATGSADGTAKLWDARTYNDKEIRILNGHTDAVWRVAFSPDSKRIATASHDNFVKVWDVASGDEMLKLSGHSHKVWGVAFSRSGRYLATTSSDLTTRLWDANSGEELLTLLGHTQTINQAAFSPDESRLATGSDDGTVRVYTLDSEVLKALARKRISPGRTLTAEERKKYLHEAIE
jgi:WD40 repeat protein